MTTSISSDFPALLTFVVIAFGWTWSLLWVGATFPLQPPWIGTAIIVTSAFGPKLAGVTTVALFDRFAGV